MQFNASTIKLIVGLGNIGPEYELTRHNAGFLWLNAFHNKLNYPEWQTNKPLQALTSVKTLQESVLVKPTTMMNSSGTAARLVMDYYKFWPQHVLVVFDDLDLKLGTYKLQFNKGPKIHNGLDSVRSRFGTEKFWHLRLGIDNRVVKGNSGVSGQTYALQKFPTAELEIFNQVINQSIEQILNPNKKI